jgi:hypothetical protein
LNGPEAHRSRKPALVGPTIRLGLVAGIHKELFMKKFSAKSGLLFGVMLAVCAFVVPSMASAASWSGLGTHQLFSPNLSFQAVLNGQNSGSSCADSRFDADVVNAAVVEITGARFLNCTGTLAAADCTATPTGANFPWTATARLTTDIQIHQVDVSVLFETKPGGAPGSCAQEGLTVRVTGTLTSGSFDPSAIAADRRITYTSAPGLTAHLLNTGGLVFGEAFVTGRFQDTNATPTLNVLD